MESESNSQYPSEFNVDLHDLPENLGELLKAVTKHGARCKITCHGVAICDVICALDDSEPDAWLKHRMAYAWIQLRAEEETLSQARRSCNAGPRF